MRIKTLFTCVALLLSIIKLDNAFALDEVVLPQKSELLKLSEHDDYLGNKAAPIILISYSSLVCNHCADFYLQVLPKLKENYIETGKVLYIHRNFSTNKPSIAAAALVRCNNNHFAFIEALFRGQDSWAFNKDYKKSLLTISKLYNMEKIDFEKCLSDEALSKSIYNETYIASKVLDVNATPVLFINGEKVETAHSYEILAARLDKAITAARLNEK